MTADCPDDFPYQPAGERDSAILREGYWRMAQGLQRVDGLRTSTYLNEVAAQHIQGKCTLADAGTALHAYYQGKRKASGANAAEGQREEEADLVSFRIVGLLERRAFFLAPSMLGYIHAELFRDLDPTLYRPGAFKEEPLVKQEYILNGDSVLYADPSLVEPSLAYLFSKEGEYAYEASFDDSQVSHFAQFVAHLWQVHPFVEGNTRTVAVFCALYLNDLGFDIDNQPFEEHARYFRNALVRANYRNARAGIMPDLTYLARFLRNALHGGRFDLKSSSMICQALFDDPSLLRNIDPGHALNTPQ